MSSTTASELQTRRSSRSRPPRPPEKNCDVSFGEDASASRTGSGLANLATIRAAIIAALKDAGYLHIPEGRRDHTTPAEPSASTASIRTKTDIHGTRRSPADPDRADPMLALRIHAASDLAARPL
jgi:hypothetical protein